MTTVTKFRWLLPVSLVLNAFFGGILVGHLDRPHQFGPLPDPAGIADRMADGLPPADAAVLRQAFASQAADLDRGHQAMDTFRRKIETLLSAPNFDPVAMKALLEGIRQAHEVEDAAMSAALIGAATKMSTEGRQRLAHLPPGPPGGGPPGGPPPRP
jgi:uncharacterized membrane protein